MASGLKTDPALATRRRPLKPLLAHHLAGEPWLLALRDPQAVPAVVQAACIASYASRREGAWDAFEPATFSRWLEEMLPADLRRFGDVWPFAVALAAMTPFITWSEVDTLLEPYRQVWRAAASA